jgi:hypothetical protein
MLRSTSRSPALSVFRGFQMNSVRMSDLPHAFYDPQHCVKRIWLVVFQTVSNMLYVYQDRQCTYERNIEARSRNYFCCGKVITTVQLGYNVTKGTEYYVSL